LALSELAEDEGSPVGLTLDAAIQRMMAANLDLLALRYEIPQADADVLTAGLRANPLLYVDTQFIPYGTFTNTRPGGPTQYDLNITYPVDLSRKRQARVRVACVARRVLEAQYQDVVRRQIGNLYRAFVDLQAARIGYLTAEEALRDQERVIERERGRSNQAVPSPDSERLFLHLDKTRGARDDARDTLDDSREALALLINLPPDETARLEPQGRLRDPIALPLTLEELTGIALESRPDLAASRLGLARAEAELRLARANRLDDAYVFYDPITYQDNRPMKLLSSRSWDIGLAIPLPIYNRNQGNIARAQSNLTQSQVERNALERRVVSEVRQAHREYLSSRDALERIERSMLPRARAIRKKATDEFAAGKLPPNDYLDNLDDVAETAGLYRDALIRHRRSMLDLNTIVGLRLLP
jgi:cobalt-zinc-cadmium efflux system outer membrane protein